MGALRLERPYRHARPMALASAVATLLAALFVCLGSGPSGPGGHPGHERAAAPAAAGPSATPVTDTGRAAYVCPYDRGDCSLFPALSPAVLSAPPLDPPLHTEDRLPRVDALAGEGAGRNPGARPRAPDLHVLQVLRT
ncbi:hypothetical protein HHL19_03790 [Streptomyces sp. R302]|uniref:hypothetical protein n=1 Tax=unclassified Streptomyces TaxID=2593676 RepID=UPI00145EAB3E|nr:MULTISPECIES: hypothetical protein [unclassified Streptomyces]NML49468.1 hypothetical protein [Streptomyces sp. R301]NML77795.1 hypothetical protein [Streptomyces sp. R302]